MYFVGRIHNPVFSSFLIYHRVCNVNKTGATSGSVTVEHPEFILGVRVCRSIHGFWLPRSYLQLFMHNISIRHHYHSFRIVSTNYMDGV